MLSYTVSYAQPKLHSTAVADAHTAPCTTEVNATSPGAASRCRGSYDDALQRRLFLFEQGLLLLSVGKALQAQSVTSLATTLDETDMMALLSSQDICMSEEQLLHIVTEWCKAHASDQFLDMMMYIDFGRLTHAQVSHYKTFLQQLRCSQCFRHLSSTSLSIKTVL